MLETETETETTSPRLCKLDFRFGFAGGEMACDSSTAYGTVAKHCATKGAMRRKEKKRRLDGVTVGIWGKDENLMTPSAT